MPCAGSGPQTKSKKPLIREVVPRLRQLPFKELDSQLSKNSIDKRVLLCLIRIIVRDKKVQVKFLLTTTPITLHKDPTIDENSPPRQESESPALRKPSKIYLLPRPLKITLIYLHLKWPAQGEVLM